jgi:hypothetical protein
MCHILNISVANDATCTCKIKSSIVTEKAAFNRKKTLFTRRFDSDLRMKLLKCYILSIEVYGAETSKLRKANQKYMESFEMWCWRRMKNISWADCVRNVEVLQRVRRRRISTYNKKKEG